jgi:hypothetical protein
VSHLSGVEPEPDPEEEIGLPEAATAVSEVLFGAGVGKLLLIVGAVAVYFGLVAASFYALHFVHGLLGINLDPPMSGVLTILVLIEGVFAFVGPLVIAIKAYRWSTGWLRRHAPRWLVFFGVE